MTEEDDTWPCMKCGTTLTAETESLMGDLILCEPCSDKLCEEMDKDIAKADANIKPEKGSLDETWDNLATSTYEELKE